MIVWVLLAATVAVALVWLKVRRRRLHNSGS